MSQHPHPVDTLALNTFFFHQIFDNNYRIKHVITKTNWGHRLHTHNFYELFFCMSDNMRFIINDSIYYLKKNDLIILNSTDTHGIINDTDSLFERYIIEFDPEYVADLRNSYDILKIFHAEGYPHILHLNTAQSQNFLFHFNKLESYENKPDIFALELCQKLAFSELLLQVNAFVEDADFQATEDITPQSIRIEKILSYISEHLTEGLSLQTLADHFYLSTSYLSSTFKTFTGYTVNSYIINKRLVLATKLLCQGMSVQEASEKSGFNNYAHFIRTFKKHTGYSPKQFSKMYREGHIKSAKTEA